MTNDDAFELEEPKTRDGSAEATRETSDAEGLDRRQLLGAVASTGAVSLAGCTVSSDGIEISFDGDAENDPVDASGAGTDPASANGASGEPAAPDDGDAEDSTGASGDSTNAGSDGGESTPSEETSGQTADDDGTAQQNQGSNEADPTNDSGDSTGDGDTDDAPGDGADEPDDDAEADESGDSDDGDDESEPDDDQAVEDDDESEPDDDQAVEDDDESESDDAETDRTALPNVRIHDFELTTTSGDMDVYGKISARGIYDEDEYITPRGHSTWEIWDLEEDDAISLTDGSSTAIDTPVTIEFPDEAVENVDERDPYLVVRGDFVQRRPSDENRFLGWGSIRVPLKAGSDAEYDQKKLTFTEGGADLRLTFSVSPLDLSLAQPIDGDLRELDGNIPTML
ncbi:hypothetical protein [Natrarchaeobaculum aegyptiacum]|uniref:DUF4382 domain-containing protein n=1 Tax=Natrarchaeobaculum aegyptiacum TaxID=745377 RepID=A0A2Z2HRA7_9EURY|nr:hypothetical protein [Natrarchaeobaculum aegyptiacum]ARS89572.1 hypothetical protein B1756_07335 [Natrarchaeobaculum aegyptiacum]